MYSYDFKAAEMDIKGYLEEKRGLIDISLESYFAKPSLPVVLHESMQYSLLSGGKRIRPILALASYDGYKKLAEGIESIHREVRARLIVLATHMHAGDGNVHVNTSR